MKVYDGSTLSEHGDVIVATINYRVGTLGFFSGFIDEAAGSMGMYDQVMAIQWIKDNANYFGGDPDNIVLMGESAGGFSVSMHLISPLSRNLFRRAILQSGTVFSPLYTDGNEQLWKKSQIIASLLGCTEENESLRKNSKRVVDCMKTLSPQKFSEVDDIVFRKMSKVPPRIGDAFLPENTIDSLKKGNFGDKEFLFGITRDEGTLLLTSHMPEIFGLVGEKSETLDLNETSAKEYLQSCINMGDEETNKIVQNYFDRVRKDSSYTYLKAMSDILGDFLITCGAVFQADYHSLKNNPVYFYLFNYRSSSTPFAEWMGVAHFDEMQYVFGNPVHQVFTEYEEELSRDIMDMWIAFAKTGNPNIPGGVEWPRYSYQDPKYFVIGREDKVGVRPDNYRCEAWRKLFRSVIDDDTVHKLKT